MKSKKLFNHVLTAGLLTVALGLNATEPPKPVTQEQSETKIKLYDSELGKTVIKELPVNSQLIKIYQKDDWVKVGDVKDGVVGWVNKIQYQHALDEFNKPTIQEIFVSQSVDKNNKPEINVIVYKNGKPVSQQEATASYEKIKQERNAQEQYWQKWNMNVFHLQRSMWPTVSVSPFFTQSYSAPIFWME